MIYNKIPRTLVEINEFLIGSTFGAEMEIPNFDTRVDMSDLAEYCDEETEIVNFKGIGNDPTRTYNKIGAELKILYTHNEQDLMDRINAVWERLDYPEITGGPTLHVHIRVPNLFKDENIETLKSIAAYTQKWAPTLLPVISPLPSMDRFNRENYPDEVTYNRALKAFKLKYAHRHGKYNDDQFEKISNAKTFIEFLASLTPCNKRGNPMWNIHRRGTFNFAKMRPTDGETFEFRMFSLTQDKEEIKNMVEFPVEFIKCALLDLNPVEYFGKKKFPNLTWLADDEDEARIHTLTDVTKQESDVVIPNLEKLLLDGDITMKDLGYPREFWEDRLGTEKYEELSNDR